MAAPDPEGFSLLTTLASAGSAVAAPVVWLWTKLDKKADKHTVNNQLQEVKNEIGIHRTYFKDVFEKLEEHGRRDEDHFRSLEKAAEDRHREILMHLLERK